MSGGQNRGSKGEEIIRQNREHTLFSWSVQSEVAPIAMTAAQEEGVL